MSKECQYCREDNIDSAIECVNCGKPFNDVISPISLKSNKVPIFVMTHLNSGKEIRITGNCIIGRSGNVEPDFFTDDNRFVSEHHCKVTLENGEYKIEHIGKNPTKVNDDSLSKGIRKILRNGDYLTIADRKFEISIVDENVDNEISIPVVEQETMVSENLNEFTEKKYFIICPKCGSEYEVSNLDERIQECNNCNKFNKREISKVGAIVKNAN